MKFRAAPVIYRAVCEGLVKGMQQAKATESATAEQVIEITASAVMDRLNEVLIFDQEEENLHTLQRIAESMAANGTPPHVEVITTTGN